MTIKEGDLVMVVRPTTCCGGRIKLGEVAKVESLGYGFGNCMLCGHEKSWNYALLDGVVLDIARLKKIDPPAGGDSLPTRADIEVAA